MLLITVRILLNNSHRSSLSTPIFSTPTNVLMRSSMRNSMIQCLVEPANLPVESVTDSSTKLQSGLFIWHNFADFWREAGWNKCSLLLWGPIDARLHAATKHRISWQCGNSTTQAIENNVKWRTSSFSPNHNQDIKSHKIRTVAAGIGKRKWLDEMSEARLSISRNYGSYDYCAICRHGLRNRPFKP